MIPLAEAVLGGESMAEMKVATEGRCCCCDCCWGGAEEEDDVAATLLLF